MKRWTVVTYLAWVLILTMFVVSPQATQNSKAPAQAAEINTDTSRGVLAVTANLVEGELLSIEMMGPERKLVVDEDMESPSFMWTPGRNDPDGLYLYEIQVVDKATGSMIGRRAGTLTVLHGRIVVPDGRQERRQLGRSLPDRPGLLGQCARAAADFFAPRAEAFTISDPSPTIVFDDTDATNTNWRIFTNHVVNGVSSIWRLFKGNAVVLDMTADEETYTTNLLNSLVIDQQGNLHFAGDGMLFNRANALLGIGTTTPGYTIDAIGDRIRLRNSTGAGAKTVMLRTDGTATDLQAENADLHIRTNTPSPTNDISLLSRRVGVGLTDPDSKLHVLGQTPPQFIVQNDAGNARMDFRRSSATGVSQLLFGTGSVATGTMDYQIGMFLDTTFQVRVTNDSTRGIALTTGGNVGIGKTNPAAKLDVAGVVNASGGYTNISDVRLKDNIAPIDGALGKVMALEGVSFSWKKEQRGERGLPDGTHYGVVAQQVEQIVPAVVHQGNDGEKSVSYTELVPVLIEAIKEQQRTVTNQQRIIAKQQGAMERQQRTIAELSDKVEELTRLVLLKGAAAGVTRE